LLGFSRNACIFWIGLSSKAECIYAIVPSSRSVELMDV
jgi:hypothetical protein